MQQFFREEPLQSLSPLVLKSMKSPALRLDQGIYTHVPEILLTNLKLCGLNAKFNSRIFHLLVGCKPHAWTWSPETMPEKRR